MSRFNREAHLKEFLPHVNIIDSSNDSLRIPFETRSLQSSLSRKRPEKNQAKDRKVDGTLQANYCSHCGTCLKDKRVGSFDPIRKYAQTIFRE